MSLREVLFNFLFYGILVGTLIAALHVTYEEYNHYKEEKEKYSFLFQMQDSLNSGEESYILKIKGIKNDYDIKQQVIIGENDSIRIINVQIDSIKNKLKTTSLNTEKRLQKTKELDRKTDSLILYMDVQRDSVFEASERYDSKVVELNELKAKYELKIAELDSLSRE